MGLEDPDQTLPDDSARDLPSSPPPAHVQHAPIAELGPGPRFMHLGFSSGAAHVPPSKGAGQPSTSSAGGEMPRDFPPTPACSLRIEARDDAGGVHRVDIGA